MHILLQRTLWSAAITISLLSGATPGHCELVSFSPFGLPYDEDTVSTPGEIVIIEGDDPQNDYDDTFSPQGDFFQQKSVAQAMNPDLTLV